MYEIVMFSGLICCTKALMRLIVWLDGGDSRGKK